MIREIFILNQSENQSRLFDGLIVFPAGGRNEKKKGKDRMKTKLVPALLTLTAGFVACIAGILAHMETIHFLEMVLIVLILFYILGCIVKLILDKNFMEMQIEETTEEEEEAETASAVAEDAEQENV